MNNGLDFGEFGKVLILAGIATMIAGGTGLAVVMLCYLLKKAFAK